MTADIVRKGVQERLDRLGVDKVDLLQFHWWTFEHPAWLDALHEMARLKEEGLIGAIGVTNFDAAHLALALADGVPVATNQVSFSLVDRRAAGALSALCRDKGVKLLAYGTLCGGFLSDKWLGKAGADRHRRLEPFQIQALHRRCRRLGGRSRAFLAPPAPIAAKHGVSISNVATRWVLEHEAVAAAIIGARHHRERAPRRQSQGLRLRARRRGQSAARRAPSPRPRRSPAIAATSTAGRPTSPRRAISAITSTPSPRSTRRSRCPAGRAGCASRPAASGSRSPATAAPSGSRTRSAFPARPPRMPPTAASRPATPARRPPTSSTRSRLSITALGGSIDDVVRTRIYLRDAAKWEPVVARPWPGVRRDHAGQHDGRGRRPDRRLRGRDRSGGGGRGLKSLQPANASHQCPQRTSARPCGRESRSR